MQGLSIDSATEQLQRLLARRGVLWAINLAALVLLTYSAAQWTWRFAAPRPAAVPAPAQAPQVATRAQDLQTIVSASLFGQSTGAGPGRQLPLEAIPLTTLNLVLTGVVVTATGSFALMSIEGRPEEPVAVGQPLTAGATLQAVYSDRAILVRGGAQEAVVLKDAQSAPLAGASVPTYSAPQEIVSQLASNQFSVDRTQLTQQMQKPEFLSQALIVPSAGGGFLVREIKPGSLYEKLGLKVGDIIRNVNGQSVNSIEDVMRIYQQMGGGDQSAAQVDIEVSRAGKPQRLQYSLQ